MSVFIIAEAGVNHNGSLEIAKQLVDKAKTAGADCIKFQTFKSESVVSKKADKADYQKNSFNQSETQLEMLKKLELTFEEFIEIKAYCDLQNIEFLSTAFDLPSIEFLKRIDIKKWKIPSGEITNLPYLIEIAQIHKPVILSTGMCTLDEVKDAYDILRTNGCENVTLLHCTTEYPAPFFDVNLKAMKTLKNEFKVPIGYSDHTMGIEIAIAAVALGAQVIEKHFTLDKNMDGPDHQASLEPDEFVAMVKAVRNVEEALGNGIKEPGISEMKNMKIARKSIIASQNIKMGEIFTVENLTVKRPGVGISPMKWFEVLGQKAIRDFETDELIEI